MGLAATPLEVVLGHLNWEGGCRPHHFFKFSLKSLTIFLCLLFFSRVAITWEEGGSILPQNSLKPSHGL